MKPLPPYWRRRITALSLALGLLLLVRCASAPTTVDIGNTSIVACGQPFDIGTRVVLWNEPSGYSAYLEGKYFATEPPEPPDGKLRYGPRPGEPKTLPELRDVVHSFVLHYDMAGTSRQCFKVLQDVRSLSVHFLLDIDGTIYQTLDLRERAWHATMANDFSVGVEIAHPGAWKQPLNADMRRWYEKDEDGWRMKFPAWMKEIGVRTKDYIARPDRPEIQSGEVQGDVMYQFDYTSEQYAALARLCAGLSRALPRIQLVVPREIDGRVRSRKLPDEELRTFGGIIGHFHVQTNKRDPGPALQWDRLLNEARVRARER